MTEKETKRRQFNLDETSDEQNQHWRMICDFEEAEASEERSTYFNMEANKKSYDEESLSDHLTPKNLKRLNKLTCRGSCEREQN